MQQYQKDFLDFAIAKQVLKFGELPQWAEQHIAQADAALLEQWTTKLLDADHLEAVFK